MNMLPGERNVPDLVGAAKSLNDAKTAIREAIRGLLRPDGSEALLDVATRLGIIADHLIAGRLLAAIRTSPFDVKFAAAELGRKTSEKKLEGIAKARRVLAEKRLKAKEDRNLRKRVAPNSMVVD